LRTRPSSIKAAGKRFPSAVLHSYSNVALAYGRQRNRTRGSITDCSLLGHCCPTKPHHAGDAYNNQAIVAIYTTSQSIGPVRPCDVVIHRGPVRPCDCDVIIHRTCIGCLHVAWAYKRFICIHFKAGMFSHDHPRITMLWTLVSPGNFQSIAACPTCSRGWRINNSWVSHLLYIAYRTDFGTDRHSVF